MPISFVCPECKKKLKAPDQAAGKSVPCPQCKTRLTVPAPQANEEFETPWLDEPTPVKREDAEEQGYQYHEAQTEPSPETAPKKKKPTKPLKEAVLTANETPGWMRHLHWALLLALVPLIISLGFTSNREDALKNLTESMRDLDDAGRARLIEAMDSGDDDAIFKALPDQKLKGAWLPHNTKMHWALALGSAAIFFVFLFLLTMRGTANIVHLLITAAFTATAGIFLLFAVQFIAEATQGRIIIGRGLFTIFFYILKFIGFSYRAALDADNGFVLSFVGFVFGVGLCEELCKALPVLLYLRREDANWHGALLWGLASGVGFGVAEGIMYSRDFYNGIYGPGIYFVRFFSCVALHALFSGSVAILLVLMRDQVTEAESWPHAIAMVLLAILPTMILHGLFDTFLKRDMHLGALISAILSFGYLAVLSYFLHGKDDELAKEEMLKKYKRMRKGSS